MNEIQHIAIRMAKRIICIMLFSSLFHFSFAWGPTGHRVTGFVADKYITTKARKNLDKLLAGQSLAMASTWMDEVRSDSLFDYMEDWHWVTVPYGTSYEQAVKNPKGDIIQTIERVINELKSKKFSEKDQALRVKILIHLIGDIHQPLHVGGREDRGGNDIKVSWFKTDSNLHRVWDSDMIDDSKLSFTELAESLEKPDEIQLRNWQKLSAREWANESQQYKKNIYDIGNGKLGYRYSYLNFPIVRERLLQAGVRLAGILNEIYG
jgi:hypothetical protein